MTKYKVMRVSGYYPPLREKIGQIGTFYQKVARVSIPKLSEDFYYLLQFTDGVILPFLPSELEEC